MPDGLLPGSSARITACGLAGGWAGMSLFRHKTRKTGFKVKMVLVSVVNVLWSVLWFWLW